MRGKPLVILALAALLTPLAALPARSADGLCFGMVPNITAVPGEVTRGTDGDDVIMGTEGRDRIRGGLGKDRICGLGGNDDLRGGSGRDRISGGTGDDEIYGDGGRNNALAGGAGNDTLIAGGDGDALVGNAGADVLYTYAVDHSIARGGPGDDALLTGTFTKLDAGTGSDYCALSPGVVPWGCETLRLYCGVSGVPLPDLGSLAGLTSAAGDFDGDADADTMYVWHDPGLGWVLHVELDTGYGMEHVLGNPAENLAAIGGYDINGDGIDEVFAQVDSFPRPVVAIGTVYIPVGSATYVCTLEGLGFEGGSSAQFPIGTDADLTNGLGCRAGEHTIRQFVQQPWSLPPGSVLQHRYDYSYAPRFGVDNPVLVYFDDDHPVLDPTDPGDAAIIQRGGEFHCGGLELP